MKEFIEKVSRGTDLAHDEIRRAVENLISTKFADAEKAEFLKALRAKGETAGEIAAFVEALLAHAIDPQIERATLHGPMLDVCGTGGDRMDLFNISTTSMFVLAAGGAVVVKHGNRAITSKCGGADVLEELGVKIDLPPEATKRCVEELGVGFLFAPNYHPVFKAIGPVRKMLASHGVATVFNMLGPLLNPARPDYQLTGVFDEMMIAKYAAVFELLGRRRAWALNSSGADEILPFSSAHIFEAKAGVALKDFQIHPYDFGIEPCSHDELRGGDKAENARILPGILGGTIRGGKRDAVLLNAGAGFLVANLARDLSEGIAMANESIDSGRALAKLRELQNFARK